jgi:hypothetical protein
LRLATLAQLTRLGILIAPLKTHGLKLFTANQNAKERPYTMNKPRTDKAIKLAQVATHIGTVCGVPFYEHPTLGDESPLLYITAAGSVGVSDFWELPDPIEFMECGPAMAFHDPNAPF